MMKNLTTINISTVLLLLLLCTHLVIIKAQLPEEEKEEERLLQNRKGQQNDDGDPTLESGHGQESGSSTSSSSSTSSIRSKAGKQPHIVMIVIDDLGWNDVDWRDSSLHTPVLTGLASRGVVLNQSYVQPVCSPSRAAFLSGFYPYHLGLQHESLRATQKAYLPANVTTLPQHLQKLGYRTHMAGKWHLGFCDWKYTPTYRGFESFVGFYNAIQDYYTHIGHQDGYDFRHNKDVYYAAKGRYSAFIFTEYIQQVIRSHNASQPLFVYLPYQSVHGPLQVPQVYIDKYCSHIKDKDRQSKCGMIAVLDEGVGNVTSALSDAGLLDDTLLLVTTDNGGPVNEGANNWPLRGSKTTLWEGGTRAMAFLNGPKWLGERRSGTVYDGVIHAVDWLPTLVEAAGGGPVPGLDGVSQWPSLLEAKVPSARTEFLYNMDELKNNSALRQGRFKLLQGNPGKPDQWYPPPKASLTGGSEEEEDTAAQRLVEVLQLRGADPDNNFTSSSSSSPSSVFFPQARNFRPPRPQGSPVVVSMTSEGVVTSADDDDDDDDDKAKYQLYDLEADPNEYHDVKDKYPDVFKKMRARLDEYRKSLVPANFPPHDPASLPSKHNGTWAPGWC